ncbi:uncharacterized protein LOC112692426 isoform X1 [Sipha flava]|uniref:Uncharacterized protein LOC112692426 isoform X1 n=1 Tax=Sipha flava TaxID=143950 RepID=A0A8B8GIP0_9HEMI|nr:uncharacterized protein LOC112692426 isoform X1 [Sipha flava]
MLVLIYSTNNNNIYIRYAIIPTAMGYFFFKRFFVVFRFISSLKRTDRVSVQSTRDAARSVEEKNRTTVSSRSRGVRPRAMNEKLARTKSLPVLRRRRIQMDGYIGNDREKTHQTFIKVSHPFLALFGHCARECLRSSGRCARNTRVAAANKRIRESAPSFFRADNVRREHAVPQSRTLPTNARPTRAPISINSVSRVWCEEVIMHMCT